MPLMEHDDVGIGDARAVDRAVAVTGVGVDHAASGGKVLRKLVRRIAVGDAWLTVRPSPAEAIVMVFVKSSLSGESGSSYPPPKRQTMPWHS